MRVNWERMHSLTLNNAKILTYWNANVVNQVYPFEPQESPYYAYGVRNILTLVYICFWIKTWLGNRWRWIRRLPWGLLGLWFTSRPSLWWPLQERVIFTVSARCKRLCDVLTMLCINTVMILCKFVTSLCVWLFLCTHEFIHSISSLKLDVILITRMNVSLMPKQTWPEYYLHP
jgi:hypothetical protein